MKKKTTSLYHQCLNQKSKRHPEIQCPHPATQGEYCAIHHKHPMKFNSFKKNQSDPSLEKIQFAEKIQSWWRRSAGIQRYRQLGPAGNIPAIAENQTDIYTFDSVERIPVLYRWSYSDCKKHIWLFDIRTLCMSRVDEPGTLLINPYTREPIPATAEKQFHERCTWLRKQKYELVHINSVTLTEDQLWHQTLLDVSLKYDMLGYHMCLSWFEELPLRQLVRFYVELWELWCFRLQLDHTVKNQVVPNWKANLFKYSAQEVRQRTEKKWWQKTVLDLMNTLVSSAELKEHKTLGALYSMTAFAVVSPNVRQHYPWLVDM